jgi:mannose-6-phosphate isomerase-like protein (cupin superfamily)
MTQPLWFLGARFNIIADATTTEGKYDLIEGYFPSGIQTPPHRHTRYSEQVYVLEGEVTVWAGADKHVLHPGESFMISIGIPHVVGSLSDKPARLLVVASPSSFARLIEATGRLEETARNSGCARRATPTGVDVGSTITRSPRSSALRNRDITESLKRCRFRKAEATPTIICCL